MAKHRARTAGAAVRRRSRHRIAPALAVVVLGTALAGCGGSSQGDLGRAAPEGVQKVVGSGEFPDAIPADELGQGWISADPTPLGEVLTLCNEPVFGERPHAVSSYRTPDGLGVDVVYLDSQRGELRPRTEVATLVQNCPLNGSRDQTLLVEQLGSEPFGAHLATLSSSDAVVGTGVVALADGPGDMVALVRAQGRGDIDLGQLWGVAQATSTAAAAHANGTEFARVPALAQAKPPKELVARPDGLDSDTPPIVEGEGDPNLPEE